MLSNEVSATSTSRSGMQVPILQCCCCLEQQAYLMPGKPYASHWMTVIVPCWLHPCVGSASRCASDICHENSWCCDQCVPLCKATRQAAAVLPYLRLTGSRFHTSTNIACSTIAAEFLQIDFVVSRSDHLMIQGTGCGSFLQVWNATMPLTSHRPACMQ
jgi:hypothetical protein